jgi:NO-binding membrane sensor protein with MHYT domain/two-component sensor histidine kinase
VDTHALHTWFEPWLVALSILIAAVSSFVAIELAGRVQLARPAARRWWLLGGAASLGCGVWALHFTGMLAFRVETTVHYDWWLVALSLALALAGCLFALVLVLRTRMSPLVLAGGSLVFAAAVAAMHYSGMAAMQTHAADRSWNAALVALSLLPAAGAGVAALGLVFRPDGGASLARRCAGGALLTAGIAAMHYLSMAGVSFHGPVRPMIAIQDEAALIAGVVAAVALIVLGAALAQSYVDRRAVEDARVTSEAVSVLREMSAGLDGRQAVCEAAQRITGCATALLYEPSGETGGLPTAPTARAGTAGPGDDANGALYSEVVHAWIDDRSCFLADAPGGGGMLLEPVHRDGAAAGVLALRFHGRSRPSRRQHAAVRLLAAEAAVAIERAHVAARIRAVDRADASARLARDLHDSVSQDLALASLYGHMAIQALDKGDTVDARGLLADTTAQLVRTQREMREVLESLRLGQRAEGAPLPELVEALAAEHERRAGAPVSVGRDVADWTRIAPEVVDALYFAVREALHNALKYAAGAPVRVELRAGEGQVIAVVRDDGPGFDPLQVPRGHWGLVGMRERAERLGGWAHVTSREGRGTTVTMALPRDGVAAAAPA